MIADGSNGALGLGSYLSCAEEDLTVKQIGMQEERWVAQAQHHTHLFVLITL